MKNKRSLLSLAALFVAAVMVPVAVSAQPVPDDEMNGQSQERRETAQQNIEVRQEMRQEVQAQRSDRREVAQGRLEEAKLRACQNRQKAIEGILTRLSDRGDRRLDVFTEIADRVEAFYLEQGNVLDNYDALVADVDAKRAAAEEVVANLDNTASVFSCEGEDPKGMIAGFKEQLEAQNAALKDYRTAVKDLIVGVKSVQVEETTEDTQEGSQE